MQVGLLNGEQHANLPGREGLIRGTEANHHLNHTWPFLHKGQNIQHEAGCDFPLRASGTYLKVRVASLLQDSHRRNVSNVYLPGLKTTVPTELGETDNGQTHD